MKKILLVFALIVQTKFYAQSLLNGGFESWSSTSYEDADSWITSNPESIDNYGLSTVSKVAGQTGFAYRMETKLSDGDIVNAFLLNTDQDLFEGKGGWPYSQQPTSITGYYRYNLPVNDTALMIVIFKSGGSIISMDIIKIKGTGSQSTFAAFSFPLSLTSMPDSVLFAATPSNLMSAQGIEPGSFLELDGLAFAGTGITQAIPNGQFENWTTQTIYGLDDWSAYQGIRTTDSYAGSYAVRLETMAYQGDTMVYVNSAYLTSAQNGNSGLPFTSMMDTLCGYYKYIIPGGGSDTAAISYVLSGDTTSFAGYGVLELLPTANYTYFELPIAAFNSTDSIRIDAFSSFSTNNSGIAGSALYLDKLLLKSNPTVGINQLVRSSKSFSFPNPSNEMLNISFEGVFSGDLTLSVYDVTGKVVKKENYSNVSESVQVRTDELLTGVYFYELTNGKETVRNKFIKK
jgi:hypothetical protein